jgi:hypothetical protein
MIRHRRGDDFLLFTQNDHALFAGVLAEHVGNGGFSPLSPLGPTVQGIARHDSGWPLYDDNPVLDRDGLPMHVLHATLDISTHAWSESVDRAAAFHPWSGLLVSQHVLRLSSLPHEGDGEQGKRIDPRVVFAINKFQHRQIEIQETLRARLGLRTDLPLTLGLAQPGANVDEDQLLVAACWLRALDSMSLDILCDRALFDAIDYVFPQAGAAPVRFAVGRPSPFVLTLSPWPFDQEKIVADMPFRSVPAREFSLLSEFRETYAAASPQKLAVQIIPG